MITRHTFAGVNAAKHKNVRLTLDFRKARHMSEKDKKTEIRRYLAQQEELETYKIVTLEVRTNSALVTMRHQAVHKISGKYTAQNEDGHYISMQGKWVPPKEFDPDTCWYSSRYKAQKAYAEATK